MHDHALWYVRRDAHVVGPFAEPLICRYIVLGRIRESDELSSDGHYWRKQDEFPELMEAAQQLLMLGKGGVLDPTWREDRIKASMRWLDERVSVDRRMHESPEQASAWASRRQTGDRRAQKETPEQHAYRQSQAAFDGWLHEPPPAYARMAKLLASLLLLVIFAVFFYRPMNPVRVGLFIPSTECNTPAAPATNWIGCDKSGSLLVGADMHNANLARVNFSGANLSYSNFTDATLNEADLSNADLRHVNFRGARLSGANMRSAHLDGADLAGAELDNAVWVDGRTCKAGSWGKCN